MKQQGLACRRRLFAGLARVGLMFAVTACGSDAADLADGASAATTETTQTSEPPTPTDPSGSTETSETAGIPEPTDAPLSDAPSSDLIAGDGYTFSIPEGWKDLSDDPAGAAADSVVRISDPTASFGTNVNVVVAPTGGITDIESQRQEIAREIKRQVGSVEPIGDITIAGEKAIGQYANGLRGQDVELIQYFTIHEGNVYVLTLTRPEGDDGTGRSGLVDILDSWAWS